MNLLIAGVCTGIEQVIPCIGITRLQTGADTVYPPAADPRAGNWMEALRGGGGVLNLL